MWERDGGKGSPVVSKQELEGGRAGGRERGARSREDGRVWVTNT